MANGQAEEKELVARASLNFIHDGQVVGLGSGSTATCMIRLLGERVKTGLKIVGIPSSIHSRDLAASLGIPLTSFDQCQQIDVAIDGADEFDPGLNLIKGGGGALLREKVVASAARKFVVVADSTKQVPVLGRFPLPMEVIRFAQPLIEKKVTALGARVELRTLPDGKPFVNDEGNHILDCHLGQ